MKQGSAGTKFVAAWLVVGLIAGAGPSCGTLPNAGVRPPSMVPTEGLSFSVNYPTYTMRNGLVVVLAPDDESNLVTVDMRYFVGAADEPEGKSGLAHLAEHLTFEAAPAGAPGGKTLAAALGEHALSYNATTSLDSTHYYAIGLASALEPLLSVEAQRMTSTCGQLSSELFERERAVVLQELAQVAERDRPAKALYALVWGADHPFSHGVGGDAVASLTRDDYCAFTKSRYTPGNATLVVGGRFDPARTLKLIAKHFDGIPRAEPLEEAPRPALPDSGTTQKSTALSVDHPTAMLVYPLKPTGDKSRVLQEVVLYLVRRELRKRVVARTDLTDSGVLLIGGEQESAVGLLLAGTAKPEVLFDELRAAVKAALVVPDGDVLAFLRAVMFTELAERHDTMLGRGALIGDHSQFFRDDRYGSEGEVYAAMTAEELTKVGERTFTAPEGRAFLFEKRPQADGTSPDELANVGSLVTQLPRRLQLRDAAPSSLALGDLAPGPKPIEFRLRNGLRVVLVPRRANAFFEARFILPVGDADDPAGRAGLAEMTAEMLSAPQRNLRFGQHLLLQMALLAGGSVRAETDVHTTTFTSSGVPSQAIMHLWRLHVLLESGGYDPEELDDLHDAWEERELEEQLDSADPEVIAERRKQRLWEALLGKMLGADHPYLRDRRGERKAVTVEDMKAFRAANYRIDGAVLVVVGGFDKDQIAREIYELWGAWPKAAAAPSKALPPARPVSGPSYLALDRPDNQITLSMAFSARSDARKDAGAQLVAGELLSERVTEIRELMAATYGLGLEYVELAGQSFVLVRGRVAPDRAGAVLTALREAWKVDRDGAGQLALEVARARRRALQRALARSSSTTSIAGSIAALVGGGGSLDERKQLAAIAAVTTDQVRAVVAGDLDLARMTVAVSGPRASEILKAAGAERVEEVE